MKKFWYEIRLSTFCMHRFGYYGDWYQRECLIYLDEYPEQEELRKRYFAIKRNLENPALKKIS